MEWSFFFIANSMLLGVGLAMDAFSVSLANGLNEPDMRPRRMCAIAGVYGFFQALMPMAGWLCVHTIVELFRSVQRFIPWIALALLAYIGVGMIREGLNARTQKEESNTARLTVTALLLQGVATSIDALSVGFTLADYGWLMALAASLIIAGVTFLLCLFALSIGKRFGTRLSWRASVLGGCILVFIGLEIFLKAIL